MNPNRLTEQEVNDFKPSYYNPLVVECDDGHFNRLMRIISIITPVINGRVGILNERDNVDYCLVSNLTHYPSQKPQPKIEILYEYINNTGCIVGFYFEYGRYPVFDQKRKSDVGKNINNCQKTGRTLKLNMETWQIVTGE